MPKYSKIEVLPTVNLKLIIKVPAEEIFSNKLSNIF